MIMEEARNKIVEYGRKMSSDGLTPGTAGNISIFDPQTGYMAISPSGIAYDKTKKEDVVKITLLTKPIERERFRLTHYGFAEPEDVELPSNFSSRWILLAVGAALIVGAIVAMRRRKGTASLD